VYSKYTLGFGSSSSSIDLSSVNFALYFFLILSALFFPDATVINVVVRVYIEKKTKNVGAPLALINN
jgi:hypothetical protein